MKRRRHQYAELAALARKIRGEDARGGREKRTTDRERIAARVSVIARVLGYEGEAAVFTDKQIERVYAGRCQRSEGAWSWATAGCVAIGSQHSMRDCLRGALIVTLRHGQCSIRPMGEYDVAPVPVGGSIGLDGEDSGAIDWYDAEGRPIPTETTS